MIADPYPVIAPRGDLTPIVNVTFHEVERRISSLNEADPQPPGYRYRLPFQAEYDPWAANRDLVVPEEAYKPWDGVVGPLLVTATRQGISYYESGLWHHVGGSVFSWCGDPPIPEGNRVFRGGSWRSSAHYVRSAAQHWNVPGYSNGYLGFRLIRGLVA